LVRRNGAGADTLAGVKAREQADRMLASDEASRALGIAISGVDAGRATATMTVRPDMANGHGICHGGYVFLLADTAFAFACNTHGPATVASGADVEFLAPVSVGDVLVAEAFEVFLRGRSGVYDVVVRRGEETVSVFRGRSRALASKPPPLRA
jgi:acyl-CoA thioesterase